tara:strand:- start:6443 stop:7696 length:1254 start_codon:yes stop_codon:yes gene_type:complete
MDKILVEGGVPLNGHVKISGSKNAVLPALAATLLTSGKNDIRNIPNVRDVHTMIALLKELGASADSFHEGRLILDTSRVNNSEAPYELVSTMRASCMVMGPLLARLGRAKVSLPGGCAIGARPVDLHLKGFAALGANIQLQEGYICASAKKLKGARIYFDTVTVTGTMNLMMAAVLAEGETILENSAREPEVIFLAEILNLAGAKIKGAGEHNIVIDGTSSLRPLECAIFPDRIEAGTYMIASAMTKGEVEVSCCIPKHFEALSLKLREAGAEIEERENSVFVRGSYPIQPVDIKTQVYPGFATDFQAQFIALMTLAAGSSTINETVFENRFMHAAELKRMGADIAIQGHSAIVRGVASLSGAPVMATDLRASASLILAGLAAKGITQISRVYHIDRGYEKMESKLSRIGARIKRVK